jgi:hypothetical protein
MLTFNLVIALLLALTSFSHASQQTLPLAVRQNGGSTTVSKTCKQIQVLTALSHLANNQTALDAMAAKGKIDQERAKWIKSEAAEITTELNTLTSNATLTAACATIDAQRKLAKQCMKLKKLEKLAALANNQTALDEQLASEILNKKQTEELKKNIQEAQAKLQKLRSNSTLVSLCANDTAGLQQNGAIGNGELPRVEMAYVSLIRVQQRSITMARSGRRVTGPQSRHRCLVVYVLRS